MSVVLELATSIGLTVTASIFQGTATVITGISCPEVGSSGRYVGAVPSNLDAGAYTFAFFADGIQISHLGRLFWDGTQEITPHRLAALIQSVGGGGGSPSVDVGEIVDGILSAGDLGLYPDHTLGRIITKLDIGGPDDPILPIPDAPLSALKGRVYLYTQDFIGEASEGIIISVELVSPSWPVSAGGYVLDKAHKVFFSNADGYAEIILFKSGDITPAGTAWRFDAEELGITGATVAITTDTYNLKDLAG